MAKNCLKTYWLIWVIFSFMSGCANIPEEYEALEQQSFELPKQTEKQPHQRTHPLQGTGKQIRLTKNAVMDHKGSAFWQRKASIHFDKLPLSTALRGLSLAFDFDFAIDYAINKEVSYQGKNIPLAHIVSSLGEQGGVHIQWHAESVLLQKNSAYWRDHNVPYLNIQRKSISRLALKQSINKNSLDSGDVTQIDNAFENHFWQNLKTNLAHYLSKNDRLIVNHEAGIVSIFATKKIQEIISKHLIQVLKTHSRQVIIEVSILEVELKNEHQQGIDWSIISGNNAVSQTLLGATLAQPPSGQLLTSFVSDGIAANVNIRLLEQFGNTKVLSSPRLQVLNNQTALLKVVDNLIYFTVDSATSVSQNGSITNFDTEINSVAVGLILALTPFINDEGEILLNLRPTISRIAGTVRDPHPVLAQQGVVSEVPIIQERELESILKVRSGTTAVIGGLMQQRSVHRNSSLPKLSALGLNVENKRNSELVLLIKPSIVE